MVRRTAKRDPVPALEWVSAALGLVALAALLFILGREIATGSDDDVPSLSVTIESVSPTSGGYVAQIRVSNRSAQTAAAVQVEGKLGEEEATATIDYVPGRSDARGGLQFRSDPRAGKVEVGVVGYELP